MRERGNNHNNQSLLQDADEHREPRSSMCAPFKRFLPLISALILGGVIAFIVVTFKSSDRTVTEAPNGVDSNNNGGGGTSSSRTSECSAIKPSERIVSFWQSEVDGCEKLPKGVTHLVFGFALAKDGEIIPSFQGSDEYIKGCVKTLQKNCVYVMGSIGGSTNNKELSAVQDIDTFASSVVNLVDKFGFDGIDIDDETVGVEFDRKRVVETVTAVRKKLKAKKQSLLLSYDTYFFEGVSKRCSDPRFAEFSRCFPTEIVNQVDWINIMAYNVEEDEESANLIYENAIKTTFSEDWKKQLGGDLSKATIGICIGSSCAFGPGPSDSIIEEWVDFAKTQGGFMIYASSTEKTKNFPVTRKIIKQFDNL